MTQYLSYNRIYLLTAQLIRIQRKSHEPPSSPRSALESGISSNTPYRFTFSYYPIRIHHVHRQCEAQRLAYSTFVVTNVQLIISVLHAPLQPLTKQGDSSHPTGFMRDGYCWGSKQDPGQHFVGAVVSQEFLQFSKEQGKSYP